MRKKMAVLMCLLLVSSMVATTAAVSAGKPDKPGKPGGGDDPKPTGTLYIMSYDNEEPWVWSMDPDGKNAVKEHLWKGQYFALSRSQHGGNWWYVGWRAMGGTYPDGQPRWHIYAVREDGQKEVQITTDDNMEMNYLSIDPSWGHDDSYISWSALVWAKDASGNDYVKESGIYSIPVDWDADGNLYKDGSISLIYSSGYKNVEGRFKWAYARDCMDWSPDGSKMVFMLYDETVSGSKIVIVDVATGAKTDLVSGYYCKWSPDGNYIAFGESNHLYIIKTDGTGRTTLAESARKGNVYGRIRDWDWSPDSKFLTYRYYVSGGKTGGGTTGIYVVSLGGSKNCVTNSLDAGVKMNVGWR
jgi:hypothetical protein